MLTSYAKTVALNLRNTFPAGEVFTLFEAGEVMGTTSGNIRFTLHRLVQAGVVISRSEHFFSIVPNKE
jgi:hypothetical protein